MPCTEMCWNLKCEVLDGDRKDVPRKQICQHTVTLMQLIKCTSLMLYVDLWLVNIPLKNKNKSSALTVRPQQLGPVLDTYGKKSTKYNLKSLHYKLTWTARALISKKKKTIDDLIREWQNSLWASTTPLRTGRHTTHYTAVLAMHTETTPPKHHPTASRPLTWNALKETTHRIAIRSNQLFIERLDCSWPDLTV